MNPLQFLSLLSLFLLPTPTLAKKPPNAILLSDVKSLLLSSTSLTTARRTTPVSQLTCLSSPALCKLANLQTLLCTNAGPSYNEESPIWSCHGTFPETVQLTRTDVICEGYNSPEDPFVLSGSCAVEYEIALTPIGRKVHKNIDSQPLGTFGTILFLLFFFGVLAFIIYATCTGSPHIQRGPRPWGWNGDGGWGGGGPGFYPGFGPGGYPGAGSGSGDGFWSGVASGAAAGYMMGSRRDRARDKRMGYGFSGGGGAKESTGFGGTRRR